MCELLDKIILHYRNRGPVILLESQSTDHPAAQYSYIAAKPRVMIKAWGDRIEIENTTGTSRHFRSNPWEALQAFRREYGGWLFGYFGYDLKNHLERLTSRNPDPVGAPDLFFMVPAVLVKYNHATGNLSAIKGRVPDEKIKEDVPDLSYEISELHHTTSREEYKAVIEQAKRHIYQGDFYEINLSHQLQGAFNGDPFQLYRYMRRQGPVPFGAFINVDEYTVCSLSPERFLRRRGKQLFSQPIKGTIQRGNKSEVDKKLKKKLLASTKEQSENLMIVDLVRNDLSRVSRPGSVRVPNLFEIQTFSTVHQMVSTIKAQSDTADPLEIIKACYPMGSMTGAPKVSAMQWIEELECYRRGIYSGAIGYIAPHGDFDFSVVIRTALITQNKLYYSVGGAITSDSRASREWEETLWKARALGTLIED